MCYSTDHTRAQGKRLIQSWGVIKVCVKRREMKSEKELEREIERERERERERE